MARRLTTEPQPRSIVSNASENHLKFFFCPEAEKNLPRLRAEKKRLDRFGTAGNAVRRRASELPMRRVASSRCVGGDGGVGVGNGDDVVDGLVKRVDKTALMGCQKES